MSKPRFTLDAVEWAAWMPTVEAVTATPRQLAALDASPQRDSPYFRTLAHDVDSLEQRSPLFHAVMYAPRGLPRADRLDGDGGDGLEREVIPGLQLRLINRVGDVIPHDDPRPFQRHGFRRLTGGISSEAQHPGQTQPAGKLEVEAESVFHVGFLSLGD